MSRRLVPAFLFVAALLPGALTLWPMGHTARAQSPAQASAPGPSHGTGAAPADADIEAGRYLATAADCSSCHSQPGAAAYSGGAPLKTVFGDFYGPNITPDPDTGIGHWTEADFDSALRRGVGHGGERLYPSMPYQNFTRITDADLHRLWLYFRSLPAVHHAAPDNTLRFPFNVRSGMAVWQAAFFRAGRWQPVADKDAAWNRGSYLVEALAHCSACHTPLNLAQAPDGKRGFTGSAIEGWYAPDISSDSLSALKQQSVDGLAAYLKTGREAGNRKTFGPMQEVVHESLSKLSDADVHAIAVYLKDQPAPAQPQRVDLEALAPERLAAGRDVYALHCSSCHGAQGRGARGQAPALAGDAGVAARDPNNVVSAVLDGFAPQGGWVAMPSFAGVLDDQAIADVANYVRRSWGNQGERVAGPDDLRLLRQMADIPAPGARGGLVCPSLSNDLLQPALRAGAPTLRRSAASAPVLQRLVQDYQAARPRASAGDIVEALSAAYCKTVAAGGADTARTGAAMVGYAQRVAEVVAEAQGQRGAARPRNR